MNPYSASASDPLLTRAMGTVDPALRVGCRSASCWSTWTAAPSLTSSARCAAARTYVRASSTPAMASSAQQTWMCALVATPGHVAAEHVWRAGVAACSPWQRTQAPPAMHPPSERGMWQWHDCNQEEWHSWCTGMVRERQGSLAATSGIGWLLLCIRHHPPCDPLVHPRQNQPCPEL
jgi:hypothetical protein